MSLEERFEALMRNFEEVRSQNEYLKKQLAKSMSNQRKNLYGTPSHNSSESDQEDEGEVATLLLPLVKRGVLEQEGNIGSSTILWTSTWRSQSLRVV